MENVTCRGSSNRQLLPAPLNRTRTLHTLCDNNVLFHTTRGLPTRITRQLRRRTKNTKLCKTNIPRRLRRLIFQATRPPLLCGAHLQYHKTNAKANRKTNTTPPNIPVSTKKQHDLSLPTSRQPTRPLQQLLCIPLRRHVLKQRRTLYTKSMPLRRPNSTNNRPTYSHTTTNPTPRSR